MPSSMHVSSCSKVGDLQAELLTDFFEGFARGARANVHLKVLYGRSESPQGRSALQGVRTGAPHGLFARPPAREGDAEHQGAAVIALIDYGAGNLTSVRKGFAAVGAELFTPAAPADLARARGIVVPGVGHFGATAFLDEAWRREIQAAVAGRVPLLGICLGLQWLFEGSDEAPARRASARSRDGALVSSGDRQGAARRLELARGRLRPSALLHGVPDGTQVYFTHSYAAPVTGDCVAATTHGTRSPPPSSAATCGACSSIRRNPDRPA